MSSMTRTAGPVTGGVDTHGDTHHAAVIDQVGRHLNDQEFATDPAGYRQLLRWLRGQGDLQRVGIEGTGSYGAGLARYLHREGVTLVEVDRPDRRTRRTRGKSDPIDAYHAARAALNETATGIPKTRDGLAEAIRQLRVARSSAVKIRTQTMNSLKALIVTAPEDLRETLRALSPAALISACTRLRPAATGTALSTTADPVTTAT